MKFLAINLESDPYFMPICSYLSSPHHTRQETEELYWSVTHKLRQAFAAPESDWCFGATQMGLSISELKIIVFASLVAVRGALSDIYAYQ